MNFVHQYYKNTELKDNFHLNLTTEMKVLEVLQFIDICNLFLLYVNDMLQAVHSDLFLYADDCRLTFQHKDVYTTEYQFNVGFANLCEWLVDNKLSIHLGEEKAKCIFFGSKLKLKNAAKFNIMYNGIEIKPYSKVTYLGCLLDEKISGESIALKIIKKINQKLKYLYRKNRFLTPELRRLLYNAIIQPHFVYACSAWYPNLTQKLKKKLQVMQNKGKFVSHEHKFCSKICFLLATLKLLLLYVWLNKLLIIQ